MDQVRQSPFILFLFYSEHRQQALVAIAIFRLLWAKKVAPAQFAVLSVQDQRPEGNPVTLELGQSSPVTILVMRASEFGAQTQITKAIAMSRGRPLFLRTDSRPLFLPESIYQISALRLPRTNEARTSESAPVRTVRRLWGVKCSRPQYRDGASDHLPDHHRTPGLPEMVRRMPKALLTENQPQVLTSRIRRSGRSPAFRSIPSG